MTPSGKCVYYYTFIRQSPGWPAQHSTMLCVAGLLYVTLLSYELHLMFCYFCEVYMSEAFGLNYNVFAPKSLIFFFQSLARKVCTILLFCFSSCRSIRRLHHRPNHQKKFNRQRKWYKLIACINGGTLYFIHINVSRRWR